MDKWSLKQWLLGIGGTLATAGILWFASFIAFGFGEYIDSRADARIEASGSAVLEDSLHNLNTNFATLATTIEAEAKNNKEFREATRGDLAGIRSALIEIASN